MMVSHDSLARLTGCSRRPALTGQWLSDQLNASTAACYDVVVCTTGVGGGRVPPAARARTCARFRSAWTWTASSPATGTPGLRAQFAEPGQPLLVHCSRLSPEKRPERAIGALAELRRRGVPAVLVVAGDGPRLRGLRALARDLPVRFLRTSPTAQCWPGCWPRPTW